METIKELILSSCGNSDIDIGSDEILSDLINNDDILLLGGDPDKLQVLLDDTVAFYTFQE